MPRGGRLQSLVFWPLQSSEKAIRTFPGFTHLPTKPALCQSPGSGAPGRRRAKACACCRPVSWGCNRGLGREPRIPGLASAGRAASRLLTRPERVSVCTSWDSGWSDPRQFLPTGTESSHLEGCRLQYTRDEPVKFTSVQLNLQGGREIFIQMQISQLKFK